MNGKSLECLYVENGADYFHSVFIWWVHTVLFAVKKLAKLIQFRFTWLQILLQHQDMHNWTVQNHVGFGAVKKTWHTISSTLISDNRARYIRTSTLCNVYYLIVFTFKLIENNSHHGSWQFRMPTSRYLLINHYVFILICCCCILLFDVM